MDTTDQQNEFSGESSALRDRWRIAWLLGIGVLVNYFDRVNLSVSRDALQHEFGINDLTFGFLLGAYNWTYAACQVPIGVVLDRFGVRVVGRIAAFVWSLASFAGAAAPGIQTLFGSRFLLGVGEAPTFPANAKAIGAWFPPHERSFATSLFDSAAKFSSALGVPLLGIVLLHLGWRMSFVATGIVSFLFFVAFVLVYRDPVRPFASGAPDISPANREAEEGERIPLRELLVEPKVIGLSLGFGSYNYVFYLLLTWLPSYLSESLHIDLMHSFLYSGVPWLVATFTDLLIGGILTDALIRRGYHASRVRMAVLVGGTAFGLGILGAAGAHTPARALAWITLSIAGLSAAAPVGSSIPSLIAPPRSVGTVGGILNLSNQISGIAAPIITGYLVYTRHSFTAAFGVAGVYLIIGIAAYILLLRSVTPIRHAAAAA